MELEEAINVLQNYVLLDRSTRKTEERTSNFDRFCEEKCIAIETLVKFAKSQISKEKLKNENVIKESVNI